MLRKILANTNKYVPLLYRNQQFIHSQSSATSTLDRVTDDETHLEQKHIHEAVSVNPLLARVTTTQWRDVHETFKNHGLNISNFLRIVTGNPELFSRHPQRIVDAMEHWRSCQFGEKSMFLLLTKYPELFDVPDGIRLRKHIGYLKSFAGTSKNVWKLLMNCPDLLEQSEQRIEEKVKYLREVMRVEIPEIIKSEALSKPLEEVRCRHVFLERLGLFKPRPLKVDPDEPSKNPRLYQITNTSENAFATKVCRVTLAEFEAFKELYERELERKRDAADADEEYVEQVPGYKKTRSKVLVLT